MALSSKRYHCLRKNLRKLRIDFFFANSSHCCVNEIYILPLVCKSFFSTFCSMGLNGLSLSKLVTLSLNLNTDAKSGSVGNEVVISKVVGVGFGVACCRRGLKEGGSEGMVMVKADVISGITITGTVTDIQKKDKNKAKTDKTEHEIGKSVKSQKSKSKSTKKSTKSKCMQTRSSSKFVGEPSMNPRRRNSRRSKPRVKLFALEEVPIVTMADQRTMAELLRAPTYAEAIVVPPISAEHLELKHSLINLVTSK
ncbi:hypothetical protein Tco_0591114 [Tanacetum coccineum]